MAKFCGKVGYGETNEESPGVFVDTIVEYPYYGEVIQNRRGLHEGEYLNQDLTVGNSISIVADAYANEHFFAIRYVEWAGVLWSVADVTVEHPRLILQLGEVYNGPTNGAPESP